MTIRKMVFDGVSYNVFTDQELEDYKEYILLDSKLDSIQDGTFTGVEETEFLKIMEENGL